jgi:transposase InsO family protein
MSDITYIKSRERTHYLSLFTDAYSRKIVGYKLSDDWRQKMWRKFFIWLLKAEIVIKS